VVYEGSSHGLSLHRSIPLGSIPLVKSRIAGAFLLPSTGKTSDRVPAYGRGRICEACGCDTVLSTYNPAPYCSVHDHAGERRPRQ